MNQPAARHLKWLCVALWALAPLSAEGQELPRKYALLIGIDRYEHQDAISTGDNQIPALRFAKKDAESLADRLARQGYDATVLPDMFATRKAVVMQLLKFSNIVREEDTFILYYAGHGIKRQKTGTVYWLNHDGNPQIPDVDGLRISTLLELIKEVPARRKLVLLDHCYAGLLDNVAIGAGSLPSGARGAEESAGRLVLARDALPTEVETTIDMAAEGMVILAASRGLAFELSENKHGIMTSALLTAFMTAEADKDKDGKLSVADLTGYVYKRVLRISSENQIQQKPVLKITGNQAEMNEWEPLMRNLSGDEVAAAAKRYSDQLTRWENQRHIPTDVRGDCDTALNRWKQDAALMSPNEERIINLLREYIDVSKDLEETLRIEAIKRGIERIRESGT
jgi:hypothetical protein